MPKADIGPDDGGVLDNVADDVFDTAINKKLTERFLRDPWHHLCVAMDHGMVVGFASAVDHIHPYKPPQLWINEVGVAPTYQGKGVGEAVLSVLLSRGKDLGCTKAWVQTDDDNHQARAFYRSAGGIETPAVVMVTYPMMGN